MDSPYRQRPPSRMGRMANRMLARLTSLSKKFTIATGLYAAGPAAYAGNPNQPDMAGKSDTLDRTNPGSRQPSDHLTSLTAEAKDALRTALLNQQRQQNFDMQAREFWLASLPPQSRTITIPLPPAITPEAVAPVISTPEVERPQPQAQPQAQPLTSPHASPLRMMNVRTPVVTRVLETVRVPYRTGRGRHMQRHTRLETRAVARTRFVTGQRLTNEKVERALRMSAATMRTLRLTPDSVIGYHRGRPLVLKYVLADRDIHQLPPAQYFRQWVNRLEADGFTRRPIRFANASALVNSLGLTESGGFAAAVSYARTPAMGYHQFIATTAVEYRLHDPFDPAQSVIAANAYIARALAQTGGDQRRALALYNSGRDPGPGRESPFAETRGHANRTLARLSGEPRQPQTRVRERASREFANARNGSRRTQARPVEVAQNDPVSNFFRRVFSPR